MLKSTHKFKTALPATTHGFTYPELRNGKLLQKIRKHAKITVNANDDTVSANDDLYEELERRYGGGYAQAIVEGLKRSQKR